MENDIHIKTAVLHILDTSVTFPVLSDKEIELSGETVEFLEKHISKIFEDANLKKAQFIGEVNTIKDICNALKEDSGRFMEVTRAIGVMTFDFMLKNIDISSGDLICCHFHAGNEPYLALLKLNYKTGFTHYVNQMEEGAVNSIIRYKTLLPSDGQKVDEAVLISLETDEIKLIEKAYEIKGTKEFYMSNHLIKCTTDLSDNQKLKIIDKVTQKISKKYYDEDFDKVAKLKKVVSEGLEEKSEIRVDEIAQEVFDTNLAVREEYIQEIQKAGLIEEAIKVPEKLAEKKFKTHKIKTDTGIEINFPLSYYDNRDMIEFANNPDGSISIIIKNVGKIINKR